MGCPVCSVEEGKYFYVKEMMLGTRQEFTYVECASCSSLYRLAQMSKGELSRNFYPLDSYYSFDLPVVFNRGLRFKDKINKLRFASYLWNTSLTGRLFRFLRPVPTSMRWLKGCNLEGFESSILDVGCGSGGLISYLNSIGFTNLTGIDPFLEEGFERGSMKLRKCEIEEASGEFDCIMFHHSLEHFDDPVRALEKARDLLSEKGSILVRTPNKDSCAWEQYGVNWVQIDAPRHRTIFSRKSLDMLAKAAQLRIVTLFCDSTAFQFWGSEQYVRGIHLDSPQSHQNCPSKKMFSKDQINEYAEKARILNLQSKGDQVVVIFDKCWC
jgi:SAM-dependent methyltransferase